MNDLTKKPNCVNTALTCLVLSMIVGLVYSYYTRDFAAAMMAIFINGVFIAGIAGGSNFIRRCYLILNILGFLWIMVAIGMGVPLAQTSTDLMVVLYQYVMSFIVCVQLLNRSSRQWFRSNS